MFIQRILMMTLMVAGLVPVHAASFNDTGMTLCAQRSGELTTQCQGTRQDGAFGRDVKYNNDSNGAAGFSYVRVCGSGEHAGKGECPAVPVLGTGPHDWRCTLDKATGLLWELKINDGSATDQSTLMQYTAEVPQYVKRINRQSVCGTQTWRVPTRIELFGLLHFGNRSPAGGDVTHAAVDRDWFPNTAAGITWTSVRLGPFSAEYWAVDFGTPAQLRTIQSVPHHVRLVSGQTMGAPERFTLNEGEATDTWTGVVWRRCTLGYEWLDGRCKPAGLDIFLPWFSAFERVQDKVDWRLPTVKELASIVNEAPGCCYIGTLDPVVFPKNVGGKYWTSTPAAGNGDQTATQAWAVDFSGGVVLQLPFESTGKVLLVKVKG